jgi:hypothetical protein
MNAPQTMLDLFAQSKEQWLAEARKTARELLKTRLAITIEDVLEVCPKPAYLHRNTIGGVFQHSDFRVCGYALAKKPSSHKRLIRLWGLK